MAGCAQGGAGQPSIVGFECGWFKFVISTVHIVFGKSEANDPERVAEVEAIAKFLGKRAESKDSWSANTILLGDRAVDRDRWCWVGNA